MHSEQGGLLVTEVQISGDGTGRVPAAPTRLQFWWLIRGLGAQRGRLQQRAEDLLTVQIAPLEAALAQVARPEKELLATLVQDHAGFGRF